MAPISEPISKHIPAWKKLGLKLKFAKEEPEEVNGGHKEATTNGKKRKSSSDSEFAVETAATEQPMKKLKKSKSKLRDETATVTMTGDPSSTLHGEETQSSPEATQRTPSSKRKSVSFAPEVKTEDGDGVKQVYKKWLEEETANDPSFDPSKASPSLKVFTPPTVRSSSPPADSLGPSSTSNSKPEAKKPKVKTKPKSKPSATSPTSTTAPENPALTYLTTHHTTASTWKFSKPHQNHLLKHLFSLIHIPSTYDPALLSYLKGLKGTSARSRIRTQALAIREEDDKWLDTKPEESEKMDQETFAECKARRKRDYDAAFARMKAELKAKEDEREEREWELFGEKEEWEQRIRKRRRAEVVLWGVSEDEDVVEDVVALPQHAIFRRYEEPPTIQSKGMGGVEQISGTGIAKGSLAKKIVFGDDGAGNASATNETNGMNGLTGTKKVESKEGVNGAQVKRKRKRKRRTTGVPDDDSSSESSSSSSSDNSEEEKKAVPNRATKRQANGRAKSNDEETSSSGSGSESDDSSSEDLDSDSD